LAQICTKLFSGWGFAQTLLGSSQRSPNPLAGKGEGKGGKGRGAEGNRNPENETGTNETPSIH